MVSCWLLPVWLLLAAFDIAYLHMQYGLRINGAAMHVFKWRIVFIVVPCYRVPQSSMQPGPRDSVIYSLKVIPVSSMYSFRCSSDAFTRQTFVNAVRRG